jgi:hypothetical protein
MGKVTNGDIPAAKAPREAKQARLRQMVTVCALVKQRNAFVGKLTKRELSRLRHQLDTSARRYRDDAIQMLFEHPELRDIVHHHDFARLRDAFPLPWPTLTKNR